MLDRGVDTVFCHLAVRGPFSARDSHEAGSRGDAGDMRTDEGFCVFGVGVTDEGTDTGPGGQDVTATNLDVAGVDIFA